MRWPVLLTVTTREPATGNTRSSSRPVKAKWPRWLVPNCSSKPSLVVAFLRSIVLQWGATDRGLVDALAGFGIDIACVAPQAEDAFLAVLGELLRAAQEAGTARQDIGVREVKALLVGCQAMEAYNSAAAEQVTNVVIDGLRAQR